MEEEVILFLLENRNEVMTEIKLNLRPGDDFKTNAIDTLKSIILRDFRLHIEDAYVILSDIERYDNDLNFFINEEVYVDKRQINN